jgi:competence protein ComEC
MARVHFVNVFPGDCTIIQHASGRVSMIDICDGNSETTQKALFESVAKSEGKVAGNFGMCQYNTNPIDYCNALGIKSVFRFILSHPDMDHMDGFNRLIDEIGILNFWNSGARKPKPEFKQGSPYKEADWDRYVKVRDGKESGVTSLNKIAGDKFSFANANESGGVGDALSILAPNEELLADPDLEDDINEGSYVVLYRSAGGRVLLCGDAHDAAFESIKKSYKADVEGCAVLLAPHHGRDSGRSYDFLDFIKPKLTIIGCAPSQHISYGEWSKRNLDILTSNQAGNIVLDIVAGQIDIYIENKTFVEAYLPAGTPIKKNDMGYYWLRTIKE